MTETSLKNLIAPSFYDVHKDIKLGKHHEYWIKGGRGSTKSSFISIEIILNLLKDPLCHAVCYRKIGNKLEKSVYNQILWAISALGLTSFFKFKKSPLEIEYLPTGQQIWFFGLDDSENSKSMKPPFGYTKILWFEELNQFDTMAEIRKVKQSVIRGSDEALIFYSYNPPPETNSWVNKEALIDYPGRLVHHSTYLDVPSEWLKTAFFLEAQHLEETNNKAYRHEYLGEVVGTGLNVFPNVQLRKITAEEIQKNFCNICEGIDWGYAIDPFVWIKLHYDRKHRTVYIFDEISQCGLSNEDAIEKVKKRHCPRVEIIADSEEPKSIDEFENSGLAIRKASKPPGSVSFGIKKLQGMKIIIDPERCPLAAREFVNYSLELDKEGNIKSKFPDKDNHSIDTVRYALEDEFDY